MVKLKYLYKKHVYGVMGTLIFHILLLSIFLLSGIKVKKEIKEKSVTIEILPEEKNFVPVKKETIAGQKKNNFTNTPSNDDRNEKIKRNRQNIDKFHQSSPEDKELAKEINAAKALVSDVNNQLSKKVPDIKDYKMPEKTTKGMDPKSISNTIYSGKSNIHYLLKNRYHVRLPIPVYLARGGGIITVDIWVAPNGNVIKAEVRKNDEIHDEMLPAYARQAALKTIFNEDLIAPSPQHGTITYTFVPQ